MCLNSLSIYDYDEHRWTRCKVFIQVFFYNIKPSRTHDFSSPPNANIEKEGMRTCIQISLWTSQVKAIWKK